LRRPGCQQPRLRGGQAAGQRGRREHQQARDEYPAAAEQVSGPPAQQQQPAERQRVGVDHPLQARTGKPERTLDVRQSDVDDRRVQHHHQLRGRDHRQGQAKPPAWRPGCNRAGGEIGGHGVGSFQSSAAFDA
jgi:hypothetical protein